jgi:hypothetical protein
MFNFKYSFKIINQKTPYGMAYYLLPSTEKVRRNLDFLGLEIFIANDNKIQYATFSLFSDTYKSTESDARDVLTKGTTFATSLIIKEIKANTSQDIFLFTGEYSGNLDIPTSKSGIYYPKATISLSSFEITQTEASRFIDELMMVVQKHFLISAYTLAEFMNTLTKSGYQSAPADIEEAGMPQPTLLEPVPQKTPEIPPSLKCPITRELLEDPVIFLPNGITYSRKALLEHLKKEKTDPLNKDPIPGLNNSFFHTPIENYFRYNINISELVDAFKRQLTH